MMLSRIITPCSVVAACAMWLISWNISAGQAPPRTLDVHQLQEMQRLIGTVRYPYGGLEKVAPDPRHADAFIAFVVGSTQGRGWIHGMPQQLLDSISIAPAHFAPAIRERLMRLPPTFEEYLVDRERNEPLYSITARESMRSFGPESDRLLTIVSQLEREHAEPILREFADAVRPLAREAKKRYDVVDAKKQAVWIAAGRPVGEARYEHAELAPVMQEWERAGEMSSTLSSAWGHAVRIAGQLGSPMFIDDAMEMLNDADPIVRHWGAWMAGYVFQFAEERPDAIAAMRAAAERLATSEAPEDRLTALGIEIALDPTRREATRSEYWRLRDEIARRNKSTVPP